MDELSTTLLLGLDLHLVLAATLLDRGWASEVFWEHEQAARHSPSLIYEAMKKLEQDEQLRQVHQWRLVRQKEVEDDKRKEFQRGYEAGFGDGKDDAKWGY